LRRWANSAGCAIRAFDDIARCLHQPDLFVNAAFALGNLGDRRAIPHLERFLKDQTDLGRLDDHCGPARVCNVARYAIKEIEKNATPNP